MALATICIFYLESGTSIPSVIRVNVYNGHQVGLFIRHYYLQHVHCTVI